MSRKNKNKPAKFDDVQIEAGALKDLGERIAAHLKKVREYEATAREKTGVELQKAQDNRGSIAQLLAEAKAKCRNLGFRAFKGRQTRQDNAAFPYWARSPQFIRNAWACGWRRAVPGQAVDGHAVDQDITDSYTNVSALRDQLCEATEIIAAFIAQHAGCDPDAELIKRLQNQMKNG